MDADQILDTPIDEEEQLDQSSSEEQLDDIEQVEDQTDDDQDQGDNDADGGDGQDEEEEQEQKPSRRENLRIQKILADARAGKFADKPKGNIDAQDALDYRKALDADDKTLDTLEADRKRYGDHAFDAGLKRAEGIQFRTLLELDAPQVASKYKQLDKDDPDNFHPAVADAINTQYLQMVGFDPNTGTVENPNIRYKDFVEGIFELADEVASTKVAQASKNIAKQAAKAAIRPDGSSAKRMNLNKAPELMSDEELEAAIGQAIPKK